MLILADLGFSLVSPCSHHDQSQTHGISSARSAEAMVRKYLAGTRVEPLASQMAGDSRHATRRVAVNCCFGGIGFLAPRAW
jgi:hypothetical protein